MRSQSVNRAMSADHVIDVFKMAYLFGWSAFLFYAMCMFMPKRTVLTDSLLSVFAVLWPILLIGTYAYLLFDRPDRELQASEKCKDDSHGNR